MLCTFGCLTLTVILTIGYSTICKRFILYLQVTVKASYFRQYNKLIYTAGATFALKRENQACLTRFFMMCNINNFLCSIL